MSETSDNIPSSEAKKEKTLELLTRQGDVLTIDGSSIANTREFVEIIMGRPNPADTTNKFLKLYYGNHPDLRKSGDKDDPGWTIIDPSDSAIALPPLEDGIPLLLGRDNKFLYDPSESKSSKSPVSRKHVTLIASGDKVNIIHQGRNATHVMTAPETIRGSIKLVD